MKCPDCGSALEPHTTTSEGWKCPASSAHVDLLEGPGICQECEREGTATELGKVVLETQTYRCPVCDKTLGELLAAKPVENWLAVEFEPLKSGLAGAFVSGPAKSLEEHMVRESRLIPPCGCACRYGLIRIGHDREKFFVNLVEACCDATRAALQAICQM